VSTDAYDLCVELREEYHHKLLHFIDTTHHYRTERLYAIVSSEGGDVFLILRIVLMTMLFSDLFEARAILLGRLGRHDQALELYVYRLQDYGKAEE
jgi:Vam6/Vps39-like protein vacuolar protein sorting-associated protein 39